MVAVLLVLCAGCNSTPTAKPRPAENWQRPGQQQLQPLSSLATQGFPPPLIAPPQGVGAKATNPTRSTERATAVRPSAVAAPSGALATTASKPEQTRLVSLREWCQAAGLAPPSPARPGEQPRVFAIAGSAGTLCLTIGGKVAEWQNTQVHLGYAPELIQGTGYVQSADLKSTIAPLLRPSPIALVQEAVIVLDPGHGGQDSGARGLRGGLEKEFTLDWARRLQALLAADGWQVWLTRTEDREITLSNRVVFAESAGAGLFLSLHFNAAAADKAGIETYCLTPAGVPSTLTRGYADELNLTLPNNDYDGQNLRIAMLLHRALLGVNGGRDRGVRRARFPTVLRGQKCPAVLIEGGYLSNPQEARLIAGADHRQKLAEAVAAALRPFAPNSAKPGVASKRPW